MMNKFVNNNGIKIHYIVLNYSKENLPLIIIPGAVTGADDIYQAIKDYVNFYCIIISIRGRGESDKPVKGYSKDEQISDIESVVQNEGLNSFYILGHSFGVSLASYYSIKNQEKIKGLIMVDYPPAYPGFPVEWTNNIREHRDDVNENLIKGLVKDS